MTLTEQIRQVKVSARRALSPTVPPCSYYSSQVLKSAMRGYDAHYGYAMLAERANSLRQELELKIAISELQNEALLLNY